MSVRERVLRLREGGREGERGEKERERERMRKRERDREREKQGLLELGQDNIYKDSSG